MIRIICSGVIAGMFILGAQSVSFAKSCCNDVAVCPRNHLQMAQLSSSDSKEVKGAAAKETDASKEAVNVGNKICPVSGEKINEKFKATYEYKGKIYNFCCAMCIDAFRNDPEKYIKKVEEELKTQSKKETGENTKAEGHMMHEGMH